MAEPRSPGQRNRRDPHCPCGWCKFRWWVSRPENQVAAWYPVILLTTCHDEVASLVRYLL